MIRNAIFIYKTILTNQINLRFDFFWQGMIDIEATLILNTKYMVLCKDSHIS